MSSWPQGLSTRRVANPHAASGPSRSLPPPSITTILSGKPFWLRGEPVGGGAQLLGGVDRQPQPLVAIGLEPPRRRELGKRRRLVVAPLGKGRERLGGEDVDPAAHPVGDPSALAEALDHVVLPERDDAEGRGRAGDGDRGCGARPEMAGVKRGKIDPDELVAVEREEVTALGAQPRREPDAAAAPEPLGLLGA